MKRQQPGRGADKIDNITLTLKTFYKIQITS